MMDRLMSRQTSFLQLKRSVIAGALMPTQAAMNNKLAAYVQSPVLAAFISFIIGTAARHDRP